MTYASGQADSVRLQGPQREAGNAPDRAARGGAAGQGCRGAVGQVDRLAPWADSHRDDEGLVPEEYSHSWRVPVEARDQLARCVGIDRAERFGTMQRSFIAASSPIAHAIGSVRRLLHLPDEQPGHQRVQRARRNIQHISGGNGDRCEEWRNIVPGFERAPETLQGAARELVLGVYKLDHRLLLILDADRTTGANPNRGGVE
mgnify:CR=1 FL=1